MPYSNGSPLFSFLNVSDENKRFFAKKEVQAADAARALQGRIGWPSDKRFMKYINKGFIINCLSTTEDIQRGNKIYGPLLPMLRGKSTQGRPNLVTQHPFINIPSPVLHLHPTNEIAVNFFFVQKRIFLLMKYRIYKSFGVNVNCRGRGKVETSAAIKLFLNKFGLRGISVTGIHGDNEFEKYVPLSPPFQFTFADVTKTCPISSGGSER